MRLARVRRNGADTLAIAGAAAGGAVRVVPAGSRLPTAPVTPDELAALAAAAPHLPEADPAGLAFLPPVRAPGKIVAIGLNYAEHAAEGGLDVPKEPVVFAKFPSALRGHGETVEWDPAVAAQVDYEAELAVVIGAPARHVSERDALGHVLGYTCLNDVSARDLQRDDGQWVRAKSLDTFCPMGPWLVTADEVPDPQDLAVRCRVSGELRQDASTADMIFSVRELIARLSRAFTLLPGDVIATGTPPGVGMASTPPRLLRDGDVVEVEIEGIGTLRNTCRETA
ncbi:fumarylacetoacetate hydrolase family protein [Actinomadura chibensis]|uniref:Fumarylacetoacetate hydrolase family protein n=1 Tax=Actinomadura chibensis TaxID=392828 RepID=A0A5D0ND05_9ACTN|nr:fumarylacetoacetate hydrolase family protein [Actinomadura chibensis]TYB42310.1 fumarylacetoacetate hydrolase family protein [Actinomadura chibensis]